MPSGFVRITLPSKGHAVEVATRLIHGRIEFTHKFDTDDPMEEKTHKILILPSALEASRVCLSGMSFSIKYADHK